LVIDPRGALFPGVACQRKFMSLHHFFISLFLKVWTGNELCLHAGR